MMGKSKSRFDSNRILTSRGFELTKRRFDLNMCDLLLDLTGKNLGFSSVEKGLGVKLCVNNYAEHNRLLSETVDLLLVCMQQSL